MTNADRKLVFAKLREAMDKRDEAQKVINSIVDDNKGIEKQILLEYSKDLFEKYPDLVQFSWRQYAPYFNDGDACTFSVGYDYIKVNCHEFGDFDYNESKSNEEGKPLTEEAWEEVTEAVSDLLQRFGEEDLKSWFGDNNEITVRKDKVVVDDYDDHD